MSIRTQRPCCSFTAVSLQSERIWKPFFISLLLSFKSIYSKRVFQGFQRTLFFLYFKHTVFQCGSPCLTPLHAITHWGESLLAHLDHNGLEKSCTVSHQGSTLSGCFPLDTESERVSPDVPVCLTNGTKPPIYYGQGQKRTLKFSSYWKYRNI